MATSRAFREDERVYGDVSLEDTRERYLLLSCRGAQVDSARSIASPIKILSARVTEVCEQSEQSCVCIAKSLLTSSKACSDRVWEHQDQLRSEAELHWRLLQRCSRTPDP